MTNYFLETEPFHISISLILDFVNICIILSYFLSDQQIAKKHQGPQGAPEGAVHRDIHISVCYIN